MRKLAAGAATTVVAACLSAGAAFAQETTGGVNGTVTDAAGKPLANAQVTVTYAPTNTSQRLTTDGQGGFSLRGLTPGGPYTITASEPGFDTQTLTDLQINLGSPYQASLTLTAQNAGATVVVRASRVSQAINTLQTGPRSTFTSADIQTLPSLNRDLKDFARLNPFVTIDPTNSNALIIAGNSNRANTFYVDGAKVSDDFGLNGNGYPGQRSPFSVDIVQSFNVEVAPMDVQYGEFTGGVINVATKSGSNEIHGGGFYEYDSNDFGSGEVLRDHVVNVPFKEKNYGGYLSGPIIKDHVFFFFDYEKYESQLNNSFGPVDSNAVSPVPGVTSADVANVTNILKSRYGFDPLGTTVTSPLPITDQKVFGKLTWQINNQHRLVFSVQDEVGISTSTNDQSITSRNLSFESDWYNFNQDVRTYTGILYSDWTPNFHTEISYSRRDVSNVSNSLAGNDFAYFQVKLPNNTPAGNLFAGPNISRQANALVTLDQIARIKGTYTLGQHTILAGYEREQLDVFNLFVQNANGNYTFNNINDLQNGNAASLTYANAFDNNKNDGAANWGDVIHTFYLQDEWRLRPDLTLKAGIRAEVYEQGDKPRNNPYFASQYGFSNQETLDGDNIIMPRLGLNYHPDPTFSAYAGAGLFSGGSPNVWVSNDYTNTGNLLGQFSVSCATPGAPTCNPALLNVNGFQVNPVAQAANSASANRGTGITNALNPNFEPPSVWKFTAGFQKLFNFAQMPFVGAYTKFAGDSFAHNAFDGWTLSADYLYQHTNKEVYWIDALDSVGTTTAAPDGRPVFDATRFAANAATGRVARANAYDLLLSSTDKGFTTTYDVQLQKAFDWGLTVSATYTHVHAEEVNPGTSSVALSNYSQNAFSDPNNPTVAISNYNIANQIKFNINYSRRIFGDNRTSVRLFAFRRSGLPYSYTFQSTVGSATQTINSSQISSGTPIDPMFGLSGAVANRSNELLYVPKADATGNVTATSDPIVQYGSQFASSTYTTKSGQVLSGVAAFNQFLKDTGLIKYNGSISPRNAFDSKGFTDADLELSQEVPVPFPGFRSKAEFYFDIFNIGNLINSNYGVLEQYGFPYFASDVAALNCQTQGQYCAGGTQNKYQYNGFQRKAALPTVSANGLPLSLWALKIGVRYKF
ncbi:MAG: TonB-dependent receptor [Caulobacteraceae bacterium]|nr:TonB-dependent receptor [Caulobacter sp.]